MKIEYQIVDGDGPIQLEEMVNCLIKDGWSPCGGIATSFNDYSTWFYQAMTRVVVDGGEIGQVIHDDA